MKKIILAVLIAASASAEAQQNIQSIVENFSNGFSTARKADLRTLYAANKQQAFWYGHGVLPTDLMSAIQSTALNNGLEPEQYINQELMNNLADCSATGVWGICEVKISDSILRLAKHLTRGRVNPESVDVDVKLTLKTFSAHKELANALRNGTESILVFLESITPQNEYYRSLRQTLRRLYDIQNSRPWQPIASPGRTLRIGVNHPVIAKMKERLRDQGYLVTNMDSVFDKEFESIVNDVQESSLVGSVILDPQSGERIKRPDGSIGPKSLLWRSYFSQTSQQRIQQTKMNMEKLRWLPTRLESSFIFVNLANQSMRWVDSAYPARTRMQFKNINGQVLRKTPTLRDTIYRIILNPDWTVPPGVFMKDKLPLMQSLQAQGTWALRDYFEQNHYYLKDQDGGYEVDPTYVDWENLDPSSVSFYLKQKPNYKNALGVVKFDLTNKFAIYLHDTGQRHLFSDVYRLLSSGCVRLEKPIDLAAELLQGTPWTRDRIEQVVAKPGEVIEKSTPINLKSPLPVYLMSLTSTLSSDGILRFHIDYYGQNAQVQNAIARSSID